MSSRYNDFRISSKPCKLNSLTLPILFTFLLSVALQGLTYVEAQADDKGVREIEDRLGIFEDETDTIQDLIDEQYRESQKRECQEPTDTECTSDSESNDTHDRPDPKKSN